MGYLKIKFSADNAIVEQIQEDGKILNSKSFSFFGNDTDEMLRQLGAEIKGEFSDYVGAVVYGTQESSYSKSVIEYNGEKADAKLLLADTLNVPVLSGVDTNNYEEVISKFSDQSKYNVWNIEYYGYTGGKRERSKESLLTVGNGYLGVRGALTESKASDDNYPGTYVASMYNKLVTEVAGRDVVNEDFVNLPNAQFITVQVEGAEIYEPNKNKVIELQRELNLQSSLLTTKMIGEDNQGNRFEIVTKKVANMENPHEYAISYTIKPLNFSKKITIISEIDAQIVNYGVERYRSLSSNHLNYILQEAVGTLSTLVIETNQSKTKVAQSADFKLVNGTVLDTENLTAEGRTTTKLTVDAKENEVYTVEKIVAVFTTLETEGDVVAKSKELASKGRTFENVKSDANTGWAKLWDKVDIKVSGDMLSQKLMRIHSFHLLVSGSPNNNNLDASITARGLHGEAYRGHIFWDEIFILPFYDVHFPATAKQILMYRYKRLEAARVYAKENGYEGAMFPWQSGSDGSEETQTVHLNPISGEWGDDYSCFQRHVSLAVAYNVWQYVNVTGDTAFMEQYGAEMILEVARFWSSKATKNETTGRYTIDKVMGPDEFHEAYPGTHQGGLRNNAYTNMMVVWLFEQIPVILEELGSKATEIRNKVNFTDAELQKLEDVKHKLSLEIDKDGIIAQYEGYFELKELDWDYFREKYGNVYRMDRLLKAEGKSADDYKVAKQADTLMTFYNLNKEKIDEILTDLDYTLPENYLEKNLEYYLARTSHGSTLSRVVHAQLAQMVNNEKLSWELFLDAVGSDYNDIQGGTTAEGIHTGVMAATLVVALSTYAGIDLREKLLVVNPHMPKAWNDIEFKMSFKGVEFKFEISHSAVKVIADKATEIVVKGNNVNLEANKLTEIKY